MTDPDPTRLAAIRTRAEARKHRGAVNWTLEDADREWLLAQLDAQAQTIARLEGERRHLMERIAFLTTPSR